MNIPTVGTELAKAINSFKISGTRDTYLWYKTFQAAMFCAYISGRADIDWHTLLLENRRYPYGSTDDDCYSIVHGNTDRYETLPTVDMKRKYYYADHDLREFVDSIIKANLLPAQIH